MQRARSADVYNARRIFMALLRPSSVEGESAKPKQRHEGGFMHSQTAALLFTVELGELTPE